jgi:hypothetical protein
MVKQSLKPPPKSLRPKTIGRWELNVLIELRNQGFTSKKDKLNFLTIRCNYNIY